jgi:very-short-patch-repair endonuclease
MKRRRVSKVTRERVNVRRREMTVPERHLWRALRDRRLVGIKFLRQYPIDPYIVDFVCREKDLIIEVDGDSHADRCESDAARQRFLESLGYRVLRVSNDEVMSNLEGVLIVIAEAAGLDRHAFDRGDHGQIPEGLV